MGQTAVFGAALVESTTGQAQNIFDFVSISMWTSSPMTGSYCIRFTVKAQSAPRNFTKREGIFSKFQGKA
jgi:hypothetical protein